MTDYLFRAEAVRFRYGLHPACGSNIPPIAHWLIASGALLIVVLLSVFLFFGTYTASDTVRGYISPIEGSVKVYAPRSGIVAELYASEGNPVAKGAPLLGVSAERLASGISVDELLIANLEAELKTVNDQIERAADLHSAKATALAKRLQEEEAQLELLHSQQKLADRRHVLLTSELDSAAKLEGRGYLAASDLRRREVAQLAQEQQRVDLAREMAGLQAAIDESRRALQVEPLHNQDALARLQAKHLQLRRELATARALAAFTLTAPIEGTVSGMTVIQGDAVSSRSPLMTLLPLDPSYCAVLLMPSRTAGFVQVGDAVNVRVDAFPYQAFGAISGTVREKSRSVLLPGEFTAPLRFNEPGYRVVIDLDANSLASRQQTIRIQSGMTVVADIMRDRRRIIEWLLEPVIGAVRRL